MKISPSGDSVWLGLLQYTSPSLVWFLINFIFKTNCPACVRCLPADAHMNRCDYQAFVALMSSQWDNALIWIRCGGDTYKHERQWSLRNRAENYWPTPFEWCIPLLRCAKKCQRWHLLLYPREPYTFFSKTTSFCSSAKTVSSLYMDIKMVELFRLRLS